MSRIVAFEYTIGLFSIVLLRNCSVPNLTAKPFSSHFIIIFFIIRNGTRILKVLTFNIYIFSGPDKLQYDAVIDISSNYLSATKMALLKFSLALRAYSPAIEMFHQVS